MQHTLIAVFDNRADAERAQDDLLASGYQRQAVRLSTGDPTGSSDSLTGRDAAPATPQQDEGFLASLRHFFTDMFGTGDSVHAQRYTDAVTRGHHVLTVTVDSEPEVERAADVVERHGPVDIDEQHAQWTGGATSPHIGGPGAYQQGASPSLQSQPDPNLYQQQSLNDEAPMGGTYQASQGGAGLSQGGSTSPGSLQRDTLGDAGAATQAAAALGSAQRRGVRVYPHGQSAQDDDAPYRHHWHAHYSATGDSYDEYAPAYRYGADMAGHDSYRGRAWSDVEPELRSDWDTRASDDGSSAWERVKEAVRRGWDRIAGTDDDAYYRNHWRSNYGDQGGAYEEYEPAYRYGAQMRAMDKYRDLPWDQAEPGLRSDWTTRYGGGQGAWERFKTAVQQGWDRVDRVTPP